MENALGGGLPVVEGHAMAQSIDGFVKDCLVQIARLQEAVFPDNDTITVLAQAVRCAREYETLRCLRAAGGLPPSTQPSELLDIIRAIVYASDGCHGHRGCSHSMEPWQRARAVVMAVDDGAAGGLPPSGPPEPTDDVVLAWVARNRMLARLHFDGDYERQRITQHREEYRRAFRGDIDWQLAGAWWKGRTSISAVPPEKANGPGPLPGKAEE